MTADPASVIIEREWFHAPLFATVSHARGVHSKAQKQP